MLYLPYCDLHGEAWALCEKYRDRPEWSAFTKECSTLITKRRPTSSTIMTGSTLDDTTSTPSPITSNTRRLQFEDYLIKVSPYFVCQAPSTRCRDSHISVIMHGGGERGLSVCSSVCIVITVCSHDLSYPVFSQSNVSAATSYSCARSCVIPTPMSKVHRS